jgi:hypothetical protein
VLAGRLKLTGKRIIRNGEAGRNNLKDLVEAQVEGSMMDGI